MVDPIEHHGSLESFSGSGSGIAHLGEQGVEFSFTGVATIGGIAAVRRILEFGSGDFPVCDAHPPGLPLGLLP